MTSDVHDEHKGGPHPSEALEASESRDKYLWDLGGARPPVSPVGMSPATRRACVLRRHGVDLLLDVGANVGQYARWIRRVAFQGRLVSFEPQRQAFRQLARHAALDPRWECRCLALGEREGMVEMHVAADQISSSFFNAGRLQLQLDQNARQVRTEVAQMARLDRIWSEYVRPDETVYLKLDVEGYELNVLRGAEAVLNEVKIIEAELSLAEMFTGAPLLPEVVDFLAERGFRILSLESNHEDDDSGQMVMVDGIFIRDS